MTSFDAETDFKLNIIMTIIYIYRSSSIIGSLNNAIYKQIYGIKSTRSLWDQCAVVFEGEEKFEKGGDISFMV